MLVVCPFAFATCLRSSRISAASLEAVCPLVCLRDAILSEGCLAAEGCRGAVVLEAPGLVLGFRCAAPPLLDFGGTILLPEPADSQLLAELK